MGSPLWARDEHEESQCIRNILSRIQLESSRSGPSVGKVMATIFWDQDCILLVDFLSPAILSTVAGTPNSYGNLRVTSGTSGRTLTSPFVTTTRWFIHLRSRVWNLRNWYGRWFLTVPDLYSPDLAPSDFHLFGPLKDHSVASISQMTVKLKTTVGFWCTNVDK